MLPKIETLFKYFQDKSEYLWVQEILETALFFNTATAMQINNIRLIRETNHGTKEKIPSFFAFIFSPSGAGKNYSVELTSEIFEDLFIDHINKLEHFVKGMIKVDRDGVGKTIIRITSPYIPVSSTSEGIQKYAQTVKQFDSGSVSIVTDEIGNFINKMEPIFIKMKQGYDLGVSEGNVISTDADSYFRVEDICYNALLFGSPEIFQIDPKLKTTLLMAYVSGMARRSFIYYNIDYKKTENRNPDFESLSNDKIKEAKAYMKQVRDFIQNHKSIKMSQDIKDKITNWDMQKDAVRESSTSVIKDDLGNPNKLERLLAIIATLDLSDTITDEHLQYAIDYSDRMDKVAEESIRIRPLYEQIYEQLENKEFSSRNELVKNITGITMKNLSEEMVLTMEYASEKGHTVITKEYENIVKYKLEKLKRTDVSQIILSYNTDMNKTNPHNFIAKRGEFKNLYNIAKGNLRYSAGTFANGYIVNDNYLKEQNLLIFDVDNDLTIKEARELLSDIIYLIATTKSHQKEKNGIICDRFRIFIPTKSIFRLSPVEYSKMYKNAMQSLGIEDADQACTNASRWFYGYPGAEIFYNYEGELLDVRPYILDTKENKEIVNILDNAEKNIEHDSDSDEFKERRLASTYKWFLSRTVDGDRNNMLFRFGCMLKEHMPEFNWEEETIKFNAILNDPVSKREIDKIIRSINRRAN